MRSQVQFRKTPKIRSVTLQGTKCGLEACGDGEVGSSITPLTQIGKKIEKRLILSTNQKRDRSLASRNTPEAIACFLGNALVAMIWKTSLSIF